LNSVVGVAIAHGVPEPYSDWLRLIQNDLFDVGADLCIPEESSVENALRVTKTQVARLEQRIDTANEHLNPLTSFVLPGGTVAAANLHLARTVCRRVEIGVIELSDVSQINPEAVCYLNRLSDLLFVLARQCNNAGHGDVLWIPGEGRQSP